MMLLIFCLTMKTREDHTRVFNCIVDGFIDNSDGLITDGERGASVSKGCLLQDHQQPKQMPVAVGMRACLRMESCN